jgi:DNA repair exonuclease SbcCD ATPase subunit
MPTPTWLQRELALIAAEAERRHEHEVESLRHRLQQCETERMQSQLHALQLEAQLQEANAQRQELEGALDDAESEIAQQRLNSDHDKREERTVEAAQLARINELSRELIATRFELAAALGLLPPTATPSASTEVSRLGLDALLSAAARLDLQAADAILNPACVLTRAVGAANAASDDDGAAATSSGLAPTPRWLPQRRRPSS